MKYKQPLKYSLILIFLLAVAVLSGTFCFAQPKTPAPGMFYKANELFKQQEYEQAKDMYSAIIDQGIESGSIYYNLGNTYFKLGQIGKAIAYYEKARILLPQDSDVKANLEYALSLCNNSVVEQKQNWLIAVTSRIADNFTLDNWSRALSAAYLLLLTAAAFYMIYRKQVFKKLLIICIVLLGMMVFIWAVKFHYTVAVKQAIVIAKEVDSRFAPSEDAVVHFKAYEGARIRIIDSNSGWSRIKTLDGKIGWVPEKALGRI